MEFWLAGFKLALIAKIIVRNQYVAIINFLIGNCYPDSYRFVDFIRKGLSFLAVVSKQRRVETAKRAEIVVEKAGIDSEVCDGTIAAANLIDRVECFSSATACCRSISAV